MWLTTLSSRFIPTHNCTTITNIVEEWIKDHHETEYSVHINFIKQHFYTYKKKSTRFDNMVLSLHTLPVHMVYRILDELDNKALFLSIQNVCQRLDQIITSYHRYQVNYD